MENKEYVYVLTHVPTGKKYVGRTTHPEMRKTSHFSSLNTGKHQCKELQADYDNLGHELKFEIVGENIRDGRNFDTEKKLMVELKTYDERYGYNTSDWAMNPIRRAHGLSYKKSNFKGKGRQKDGTNNWWNQNSRQGLLQNPVNIQVRTVSVH